MPTGATNVPRYLGFVSDKEVKSVDVYVPDPGADLTLGVYRFPVKGRIRAAYAIPTVTTNASGTHYYSVNLNNGGTAGTATTSVSGTSGGTAGWTALTPTAISITSAALGEFSAGQWVNLVYDEEGTVAPAFTLHLDIDLYPTS